MAKTQNKTKYPKKRTAAVTLPLFVVILIIALIVTLYILYTLGYLDRWMKPGTGGDNPGSGSGNGGESIITDDLQIHFLELGNKYTGDCTLIKVGDTEILVDAGSRQSSAGTITSYVKNYCTDGVLEYVIATHGDLTQLTVSKTTLFLGLASALATVFYNLLPGNLMSEYGTFAIVGWGMLISGIGLIPIVRPWTITAQIIWDWQTFLCVMVVIIMGTVLSFGCYMEGLRLIGGTRASLFASVEPLTATLASVLFMGVSFEFMDLLGFAGIIGAVIILSLPGKKKN